MIERITRTEVGRHLEHAVDDEALIDELARGVGDARIVLLGEASHGTHEFYDLRAALTRRLISGQGFQAVACEADWPDAYRVNRFVRGLGDDGDAVEALGDFRRFPRWMWRNTVVAGFVDWLRRHNEDRHEAERVGFYGLDLYSMHASIQAVLAYLAGVDPAAEARAREAYACLDHHGRGQAAETYGRQVAFGLREDCVQEVRRVLFEVRRQGRARLEGAGLVHADRQFAAVMNAQLVSDAEAYYRLVFDPMVSTWNLRDYHMMHVLQELDEHLAKTRGRRPRIVVWAHNSHIGDARAGAMSRRGELNIGQLVRERLVGQSWHLGFTTDHGSVTAAHEWGDEAMVRTVQPALRGSHEALLHELAPDRCLVDFRDPVLASAFATERLERAIGVIYRPETERASHYFESRLSERFDAVVHIDRTTALHPLDAHEAWSVAEAETWPSGL